MPSQYLDPPNKSTNDPNSFLDQFGNIRRRNADYPDPNSIFGMPPTASGQGSRVPTVPGGHSFGAQQAANAMGINANVQVGPAPGSAIDQYYQKLVDLMPSNRQSAFGDLSQILGAYSSGEKADRVVRGNFQGDYDRLMAGMEADRNRLGFDAQSEYDRIKLLGLADKRESDSDAFQKLQAGSWLAQGGNASAPGGAHRAVSDAEKQAGSGLMTAMTGQLNRPAFEPTKFTPSYSYTPMNPSEYAKPGAMEKLGSYGSIAMGGLGAIDRLTGGKSTGAITGLLGKIPGLGSVFGGGGASGISAGVGALGKAGQAGNALYGASAPAGMAGGAGAAGGMMSTMLGKALPVAGAVTGGIGLMKNRGTGANIMNGITTGSSIGMMAGGPIGAGIGAGVGALAGWGRGAFGVSEQEKAGRGTSSEARQLITSGATPQQQAEAQAAGWASPEDALMNVVLRDKLGDPAKGQMYFTALKQAEKQGPEAVQSVIQRLMQELS